MSNADSALDHWYTGPEKLDLFDAPHSVWIPPTVDLLWEAPCQPSGREAGPSPWLRYPEGDYRDWPHTTKTSGLVQAFLRLTNLRVTERKDLEKVQAFAKTWGPLWLCQTPGHRGYGSVECYYFGWAKNASLPCTWHPQESAAVFVRKAQELKAVLNIVEALDRGLPVPIDSWQRTGLNRRSPGLAQRIARRTLEKRCTMIAHIVSCHLLSYGIPALLMTWEKARKPRLISARSSGFLRAVWVEIAQIICRAKGYCTCTTCGEVYTPPGNYTPRANQSKYCNEECKKKGRTRAKARERAHKRAAQAGEDAAVAVEQAG